MKARKWPCKMRVNRHRVTNVTFVCSPSQAAARTVGNMCRCWRGKRSECFFLRVPGGASRSGLGLSSCCCAASDLSTSRCLAHLVPHSCRQKPPCCRTAVTVVGGHRLPLSHLPMRTSDTFPPLVLPRSRRTLCC